MTEIDIAGDQENTERGGTADTDLQLESEQRAMQVLYDYQSAARTASETARHRAPLPALQTYSDLPREWPMARLAISSKQINRLVRTFLWRRVTEQALHFFFHECGRRVGMVPRSSLKEGKKGRWWRMERRPQKTNPKPNTQARRPTPPSSSLPYTLGETCETETSDN